MIDTHAHLTSRFCDVLKEMKLDAVILAASNLEDSKENIILAKNNQKFYAAAGIHPQDTNPEAKIDIAEQLKTLDLLVNNDVIAIGECGLDYSPVPPEERERSKEEQAELFLGQIDIAKKNNLPLIIHSRKTMDEVLEILKKEKAPKGVIHCYSGGKKRIQKVLDLGENWYFGIDGNLTYEDGLAEVIINIPKDRLVLETDSPFLTPIPHRGEANSPEYVRFIYEKVAEIWNISLDETEKIIDGNAKKLFDLKL